MKNILIAFLLLFFSINSQAQETPREPLHIKDAYPIFYKDYYIFPNSLTHRNVTVAYSSSSNKLNPHDICLKYVEEHFRPEEPPARYRGCGGWFPKRVKTNKNEYESRFLFISVFICKENEIFDSKNKKCLPKVDLNLINIKLITGPTCTPSDGLILGHPILASSGEKILEEEDHAGSGAGALVFERRWLSSWALAAQQNTAAGAAAQGSQPGIRPLPSSVLGAGWSHNHIGHITPSGAALAAAPLITVQLPDGNSRTFSKDAAGKWTAAGHPELQLTLAADGAATLTDTRANTRLNFDAAGRITAATARNGWQTTYTYNQAGQLTHIRNAFGRDLTLTYTAADARGLLASVITPDGAIRYEYDSAPAVAAGNTASPANETHSAPSSATSLQRLKAVIYPDGSRKTYLYEDPARPYLLTGTIDQNGTRQATYAYDSLGRATSTQWAAGADRYSVRYNGNNPPGTNQGTVSVTDPLGASRSYSYQYNNGQTAVGSSNLAPAGNADPIRSRVQDAQGNVTSETSFTGSRTDYRWNARRLLEQITRAAGRPEQQSTVYEWHPRFSLPKIGRAHV